MAETLTDTLKKEAQEVADMIKAATTSLMPQTQSRRRSDEGTGTHAVPTDTDKTEKNESEGNFSADLESFLRSVLGSCGGVIEAASFLVKNSWKPSDESSAKGRKGAPRTVEVSNGRSGGLSFWVTDSKRPKSLFFNARASSSGFPQTQEIPPPFRVGEDGEHCLDISQNFDDNISALSAHTLEEMATHSFRAEDVAVPPPLTPVSSSSGSSKEEERYVVPNQREHRHGFPDAYFINKSRRASKKIKVSEANGDEDFGEVKFLQPRSPHRYLEV